VTQLTSTVVRVHGRVAERRASKREAVITAIRTAHAERGPLLVFVAGEDLLVWAAWFNLQFPGPVVVARDLEAENRRLMAQLPDHLPMRLTASGQGLRLSRLE
jgi:hypothetical protein